MNWKALELRGNTHLEWDVDIENETKSNLIFRWIDSKQNVSGPRKAKASYKAGIQVRVELTVPELFP